jgi:predicted ATP-grasp superfamily ATP-dependent carboligase
MRSRERAAVVLGRIDLVRALGRAGIPSVVVTRPDDPIRHSRLVAGVIHADAPALVDALLDHARGLPEPPPLFYDSDAALLFLSRNRERLGGAYRFVLPEAELVDDLLDKARFRALAERLDLPVPPSRLANDLPANGEVDLRFPVVIKASPHRDERWDEVGLSSKVLRVDDPAALRDALARIERAGIEAIAQELIPGPEDRIESHHVYVDADGRVAAEFTGRKIRTAPREFGMSTALVTTDDEGVAALGREVVERLRFRGVAKLDFKRDPEGRLHLLEVNPRFTLWTHVGAVAGVNLPAIVHADLTGSPRPPADRARAGVRWIWPSADRAAARESGVSFPSWLVWALRSETNSSFALWDPAPYVFGRLRGALGRGAR